MKLRSRQTRWFEVFVPRDQVVYALEALADTHSVQLELDPRFTGPLKVEALTQGVRDFDRLAAPYRDLLPDSADKSTRLAGPPEDSIEPMLRRLQCWCDRLQPLLAMSRDLAARLDQLRVLEQAALAMGEAASQLPQLGHSSDLLFKALYRCPPGLADRSLFEGLLEQSFSDENQCFVVIACLPEQRGQAIELLSASGCETVPIPADLDQQPGRELADIRHRQQKTRQDLESTEARIQALREDTQIAEALANVEILRWFLGAARHVGVRDSGFCHITGWTSETDPERLQQVLQSASVEAEVRFARPPLGVIEPITTAADWWRQPFQIFTAMSGAPSPDEIDPTGLLAVVVPLLFGYMFHDTGHGLVVAAAGVVLSRRSPRARLLISCGITAALMGIVFDDFFGYPLLNQPWQIHALDDPILILLAPMFFGIGLLLLGLVFNGIELYWRGQLYRWLLGDAAVLVLYASLLSSLLFIEAVVIAVVALCWYAIGAMVLGGRHWARQLAVATGELAHSALSLSLNTISFARVGAFALAHVGLTLVVTTLVEAIEHPLWSALVFIVGHVMVIVLEGLVVFVQITRLILFEFFIQFLRAEGRFFRPHSAMQSPRER